jgi:hypothetical protein
MYVDFGSSGMGGNDQFGWAEATNLGAVVVGGSVYHRWHICAIVSGGGLPLSWRRQAVEGIRQRRMVGGGVIAASVPGVSFAVFGPILRLTTLACQPRQPVPVGIDDQLEAV